MRTANPDLRESIKAITTILALLLLFPVVSHGQSDAFPVPAFVHETPFTSTDGSALIDWKLEAAEVGATFELEQSTDRHFSEIRTRYQGKDQAFLATGLREGVYFYRVRCMDGSGAPGAWSEVLELEVAYQNKQWLWPLFWTGVTLFVLTLVAIVSGTIRARKEETA